MVPQHKLAQVLFCNHLQSPHGAIMHQMRHTPTVHHNNLISVYASMLSINFVQHLSNTTKLLLPIAIGSCYFQ